MYYHDHLFVDYEHPLQFILASHFVMPCEAEESLDALYADCLPLEPVTVTVASERVERLARGLDEVYAGVVDRRN